MTDVLINEENNDSYTMEDFEDTHRYDKDEFPEYPEDIEDDEDSVETSDSFSVVGKNKKPKKKKVDKGRRKYKTKDGNIVYFATSMIPGNSIRDAIFGRHYHEYKVGTPNEDLFFKVSKTDNCSTQNIDTLFYENPEQFESHMNVTVNSDLKSSWAEKYQYALHCVKKQHEEIEQQQVEYTTVK